VHEGEAVVSCTFLTLPGGVQVIACTRGQKRAKPCASCTHPKLASTLLCDGCDQPLCAACAVSPRPEQDFCPTCARTVFVTWLRACELGHLPAAPTERMARRAAFRAWARENPAFFDPVPRTAEGKRAGAR
jgi:hypothetical protein